VASAPDDRFDALDDFPMEQTQEVPSPKAVKEAAAFTQQAGRPESSPSPKAPKTRRARREQAQPAQTEAEPPKKRGRKAQKRSVMDEQEEKVKSKGGKGKRSRPEVGHKEKEEQAEVVASQEMAGEEPTQAQEDDFPPMLDEEGDTQVAIHQVRKPCLPDAHLRSDSVWGILHQQPAQKRSKAVCEQPQPLRERPLASSNNASYAKEVRFVRTIS
jgi:hypothetical protein